MFVDKTDIQVKAGNGGNGAIAFHREKYVASGGPDGGDGGHGGDVIIRVDDNMSTLMDYRYKKKYTAGHGQNGQGSNRSGKSGDDLIIKIPRGTLVRDRDTGGIIVDMSETDKYVIAKGGKGGWGNQHFATPSRQAPRFAKNGLPGESRAITLELKLLADVGLVGYPNVGKSTLLSVMSNARPKIANYHFTTLFPNLGVVRYNDEVNFVLADIPGLIEGAAEGAGLGDEFLRHVDRCRLLIHVVDVSGSEGRNPTDDFEAINSELAQYSAELATRPQIVAANKCDISADGDILDNFEKYMKDKGHKLFKISAATHQGVKGLMDAVAEQLAKLPPVHIYQPDYVPPENPPATPDGLIIEEVEDGVWSVEGEWLEELMGRVNFSDYESKMYFERSMRDAGVYERMERQGVSQGDTVIMYELEFDYEI